MMWWLYLSAISMRLHKSIADCSNLMSHPASSWLLVHVLLWKARKGQWLCLRGVTGIFKLQLPPKKANKFKSGAVWVLFLVLIPTSVCQAFPRLRLPLVSAAFASFVLHTKDFAHPLLFPYFHVLGTRRVCHRGLKSEDPELKRSCGVLKIHLRGTHYSHTRALIYSNFFPHFCVHLQEFFPYFPARVQTVHTYIYMCDFGRVFTHTRHWNAAKHLWSSEASAA